uniref:Lactation elevated protein 1 n=1 Tax=Lygus hesperus TaxID=30085 RepID=A0A0A9YQV9_LYGHE
MMMDMFYNSLQYVQLGRRREHFHQFMIDIHTRLHILRKEGGTMQPLHSVAQQYMLDNGPILCLDEFQVIDVADAMILRDLFETLFSLGCILITTSNREPSALYANGINRDSFLPFIDVLHRHCDVVKLENVPDFRQLVTMESSGYYCPINSETCARVDKAFTSLSAAAQPEALHTTIQVYMGRTLCIRKGVVGFVAQFTFNELCLAPLSALDYTSIAEHFPCIIITDVPVLNLESRDVIRRFITLLDILYDHRTNVIFSSNVPPQDLFPKTDTNIPIDEAFAISRAISRVVEMTSLKYIQRNTSNIHL